MSKKSYTLLITSNRRGKTRSFSVSASLIKKSAILVTLFFVVLVVLIVDYSQLLIETNHSAKLRVENESLKNQFTAMEGQLRSLEVALERVKSFATKLKLITNIDDEDRSIQLNIGSTPQKGKALSDRHQPLQERMPASEFLVTTPMDKATAPTHLSPKELLHENKSYATLSIRIDKALKETQLREQNVLELYEVLVQKQSLLNSTPSIQPIRGWVSSYFGYRIGPFSGRSEMHKGLDIAAPRGTPVYSPAKGVVSYVGYEQGYGKIMTIDHGYGIKTRFAHNSQIFVELGQKVNRREIIAAVGSTGRSSGPHLHYEIRLNGIPVDPQNYILDR